MFLLCLSLANISYCNFIESTKARHSVGNINLMQYRSFCQRSIFLILFLEFEL